MENCVSCEEIVKKQDGIQCTRCKAYRHMKKKCCGVSKASFEKDRSLRKKFICESCLSDSDSETDEDEPITPKKSDKDPILQILKKITDMEKRWDRKMDQFRSVIDLFSSKIDDVTKLRAKVTELSERVKRLERTPREAPDQEREKLSLQTSHHSKERWWLKWQRPSWKA